jgi:hypothetical protein
LLKLGIDIGERSVSRFMPPRPRKPPAQTRRSFLDNDAGSLASIDFFTVPTTTFRILYVLFVVDSHLAAPRMSTWRGTVNPCPACRKVVRGFCGDGGTTAEPLEPRQRDRQRMSRAHPAAGLGLSAGS